MPTIISTKNILDNANDFKYIAEKIVSDIDTKYKHYPVQFFVNGLLSIELYLKTIYFANNGDYPKNDKQVVDKSHNSYCANYSLTKFLKRIS